MARDDEPPGPDAGPSTKKAIYTGRKDWQVA